MARSKQTLFTADAKFAVTPATDDSPAVLTGYPLVWNVLSSDRGGYVVRLLAGSAQFTAEVHALWNHDYTELLASTHNGSLRLKEDDVGIKCEIDLPNTTSGRDVGEYVRTGLIRGMSFGMVDMPQGQFSTENGVKILNANSYTVDEVTVTPIPAFVQTNIAVKTDQSAAFSARQRQSLQLQKIKFQTLRLAGDGSAAANFTPARAK